MLAHGPMTVAELANELGLSAAGVRKQLDLLGIEDLVAGHEAAPFGPLGSTDRGRGRPAKVFALTAKGRGAFEGAYESVAIEAIALLKEIGGEQAVRELMLRRLGTDLPSDDLDVVANWLSEHGYEAQALPAPFGDGMQLCQRNCPVGHAAAAYPELCEAESDLLSERLGRPVTRLSTMSSGADICTLHVSARRSA